MQSPLPLDWVDRLFGGFAVRYGSEWLRMWEGINLAAVKADWADVLAGLQHRPEALRYGLQHLPDRPPTSTQFKAVCARAPVAAPKALPAPPSSPEGIAIARKVAAELKRPKDRREWARKLRERHAKGERLTLTQIDMYRDALRQRDDETIEDAYA